LARRQDKTHGEERKKLDQSGRLRKIASRARWRKLCVPCESSGEGDGKLVKTEKDLALPSKKKRAKKKKKKNLRPKTKKHPQSGKKLSFAQQSMGKPRRAIRRPAQRTSRTSHPQKKSMRVQNEGRNYPLGSPRKKVFSSLFFLRGGSCEENPSGRKKECQFTCPGSRAEFSPRSWSLSRSVMVDA